MQQQYQGRTSSKRVTQKFDIAGLEQSLTLDELINHIELVRELTASRSPRDLKKRLIKALKRLGFSDLSLCVTLSTKHQISF